jgi:hypothetical protein
MRSKKTGTANAMGFMSCPFSKQIEIDLKNCCTDTCLAAIEA